MSADKDCWGMLRRGQMEEKEIPEGHDLRTKKSDLYAGLPGSCKHRK